MSSAEVIAITSKLEGVERLLKQALANTVPARAAYTPAEVAQMIGMSERWVADQCAARLIPTVNKRPYLIPASYVEKIRNGK